MANEHLNLQRHITDRTLSILKQVEVYEENNKQRYLQGIIERASAEIDNVKYYKGLKMFEKFFFFFVKATQWR